MNFRTGKREEEELGQNNSKYFLLIKRFKKPERKFWGVTSVFSQLEGNKARTRRIQEHNHSIDTITSHTYTRSTYTYDESRYKVNTGGNTVASSSRSEEESRSSYPEWIFSHECHGGLDLHGRGMDEQISNLKSQHFANPKT